MSTLILLTGLISFGCIPMLAAGLWLTVGKKNTTTKILGGVINLFGRSPSPGGASFLVLVALPFELR